MRSTEIVEDARRAMDICNACRYCEGFCAVFPAMEMRREFSNGDLSYLANLCHNCRGCYYACQYAPPHPFSLNLPRSLAQLRAETYEEYAWPRPLAGLFRRNGLVVSLATAAGIAAVLILTMLLRAPEVLYGVHRGPGAFYKVIPWGVLVVAAGVPFVFSWVALIVGAVRFWRDTESGRVGGPVSVAEAVRDVLTLRYLGGGGHGCNDRDESFSQSRRWLHHAMFYGFMLCFASTCLATIYADFLGHDAPYPFFSGPVLLGTVGGVLLTIGTGGLVWLKVVGDREPAAPELLGADFALLFLLMLSAVTGLLLLALRDTGAMGVLLAVHFGIVLALFVTVPYSKFVHAAYRAAALLRYSSDRRREAAVPDHPEQRGPESEDLRVALAAGEKR